MSLELTGLRVGRLLVKQRSTMSNSRHYNWECLCDCGSVAHVSGHRLKIGKTLSCGCLAIERLKQRCTKHGQARTKEYYAWHHMLMRCTNPQTKQYADYGGRGIFNDLPDITEILMNPATATVPAKLDAKYATMGAVAKKSTADNFEHVCVYTNRFPPELRVTCIKDAIKMQPAIKRTRAFQSWASANADILI